MRGASTAVRSNPKKLNALQLRTLAILQAIARQPLLADPPNQDGTVTIHTLPHRHGDHLHVGAAVVSARDASGLANPNVLNALARKGLARHGPAGLPCLTLEGRDYPTGIAPDGPARRRSLGRPPRDRRSLVGLELRLGVAAQDARPLPFDLPRTVVAWSWRAWPHALCQGRADPGSTPRQCQRAERSSAASSTPSLDRRGPYHTRLRARANGSSATSCRSRPTISTW